MNLDSGSATVEVRSGHTTTVDVVTRREPRGTIGTADLYFRCHEPGGVDLLDPQPRLVLLGTSQGSTTRTETRLEDEGGDVIPVARDVAPGTYRILVVNDSGGPPAGFATAAGALDVADVKRFRVLRMRGEPGLQRTYLFDLAAYNQKKGKAFEARFGFRWEVPARAPVPFLQTKPSPTSLPPLTLRRPPPRLLNPGTLMVVLSLLHHRNAYQCVYARTDQSPDTSQAGLPWAAHEGFAWTTHSSPPKAELAGEVIEVKPGEADVDLEITDLIEVLDARHGAGQVRPKLATLLPGMKGLYCSAAGSAQPRQQINSVEWAMHPTGGPRARWLYGDLTELPRFAQLTPTAQQALRRVEKVLGVARRPDVKARLEIRLSSAARADDPVEVTLTAVDPNIPRGDADSVTFRAKPRQLGDRLHVDIAGTAIWDRLYGDVGSARMYTTFVQARVELGTGQTGATDRTVAYPVIQPLLFFLPGVYGAALSVERAGSIERCWPAFAGEPEELLVCRADGKAYRDAHVPPNSAAVWDEEMAPDQWGVLYTVAAAGVTLRNVYASLHGHLSGTNPKMLTAMGVPPLYLEPAKVRRLQPIVFHGVPYDWRLPRRSYDHDFIERVADRIMALRRLVQTKLDVFPFASDTISLAGHSTGGLVARGLVSIPNSARGLIGQLFFLNVPFWGAPHAEYVFLTGDADLGPFGLLMDPESARQIAPNLPIGYFLSPSDMYGAQLSEDWAGPDRQRRVQQCVSYDTSPAPLHGWDPAWGRRRNLEFNLGLSRLADRFHERCWKTRDPATPAYVFHSAGRDTTFETICDSASVAARKGPLGDGTVPSISQVGIFYEWPDVQIMVPTPGNPDHASSPNQRWVSRCMADVLLGRKLVEIRPATNLFSADAAKYHVIDKLRHGQPVDFGVMLARELARQRGGTITGPVRVRTPFDEEHRPAGCAVARVTAKPGNDPAKAGKLSVRIMVTYEVTLPPSGSHSQLRTKELRHREAAARVLKQEQEALLGAGNTEHGTNKSIRLEVRSLDPAEPVDAEVEFISWVR